MSKRLLVAMTAVALSVLRCRENPTAPVDRLSTTIVAAPLQIAPADSSIFNLFPRTTHYVWHTLPQATGYALEIDCFHCCVRDRWCSDVGQPTGRPPISLDTTFTDDFVGAQPGRWRVWAVDSTGARGPRSPWRYFAYTI